MLCLSYVPVFWGVSLVVVLDSESRLIVLLAVSLSYVPVFWASHWLNFERLKESF